MVFYVKTKSARNYFSQHRNQTIADNLVQRQGRYFRNSLSQMALWWFNLQIKQSVVYLLLSGMDTTQANLLN